MRARGQYLHSTTMVAMAARAEYVRATPTLISRTRLVTTATSRKSLARAGTLRKTTSNMATSKNKP